MSSTLTLTKQDIIEALNVLAGSDIAGTEKLVVCSDMSVGPGRGKFPYMISIEGNIGAGKSTLLEKMRQKYYSSDKEECKKYFGKLSSAEIVFLQEPVMKWESFRDPVTGESILQKFYKDPKTYSLAFQVMVYNTMLQGFRQAVKENPDCKVFICERSIDASRHIFTQMLRDDGMIDAVSFQIYMNMYENNVDEFPLDAVLYLDVDPTVCLERVAIRSREGENEISLEYLQKCDRYYKKWLIPDENV